jgi:DNA-directed RNA polymerase subunit RPC12/RpoP
MTAQQRILTMHAEKLSVHTIARRLNLSANYVKRIISESADRPRHECLRCSYRWIKLGDYLPVSCPSCKNRLWNNPRKNRVTRTKEMYQKAATKVRIGSPNVPIDPTPAEIADKTAAIRQAWSEQERRRRAGIVERFVETETVNTGEISAD